MRNKTDKSKRPVRDVPLTPTRISAEILAVMALLVLVVPLAKAWPVLPERVPTHFGISGRPDAWGSKQTLLLMPAIGLVMYVMFTVLCRFPHLYNYPFAITEENAARQYQLASELMSWTKAMVLGLFATLQWGTIRVALGQASGLSVLPNVFVVLLLGSVAIYMVAAYRAR